jgi:hypothetical protein
VTAVPPRRDNGLSASSYARLDDVETHLVDELLSRLREAGVAAYSAPSSGRQGPYGETVPPAGPSQAVFVDAAHRDRGQEIREGYLREVSEELAWSDIVAGFDQDTDDAVPRWPVAEDVSPDEARDDERSRRHGDPGGATIGFDALRDQVEAPPRRQLDDPEDHYEPPPPPPLPEIDRIGRFAWAGFIGGPLLLLLAALAGLRLEGWVGVLAIGAFMAGFVTLVARMKERPPTDSGPDDGAVV